VAWLKDAVVESGSDDADGDEMKCSGVACGDASTGDGELYPGNVMEEQSFRFNGEPIEPKTE
jgi:hypothetical protein